MDAVFGADFLLTALVVVLVPGTGVVYTLAHGLGGGARASVVAATGCTLGILPHLGAALVGLAALLHASALAFQAVKVAGVIYLLYLAWMTLREKGALAVTPAESPRDIHAGRIALGGFLVNILNPKLSIFFLAFLPQFLSPDQAQATATMAAMGGVFMAMTLVVFIGYGLFAAGVRRHLLSRPVAMAWMRRIFAGTFVALGARLALTER